MKPREWALEVVKKLQAAGFESLFAGGCVRDSLLHVEPKDFDVATAATPDQVEQVFGNRRTLAIGKSFGVITVLGPRNALNVEVATFRRDGDYSDARRPDSVEFTNAREDALRRDFTINGMFFDPVSEKVIDYVDGQQDLQQKLIRAIGNPQERIAEDRLRMLRGVRFAARFDFEIEAETMAAIQQHAADIVTVSSERIGNEVRNMLTHHNRAVAFELLIASGLWQQILPAELASKSDWKQLIDPLRELDGDFTAALAVILRDSGSNASTLQDRWRLTNDEVARSNWILKNAPLLSEADQLSWSQLQPLLISLHAECALQSLSAIASADDCQSLKASIRLCKEKLSLESEVLNPPPLLRGDDLKALGVEPGPDFKRILNQVRQQQLDGQLTDSEQAKQWVRENG